MTAIQTFNLFSPLDLAALFWLVLAILWIGWRIESPPRGQPSVSILMMGFRREWMRNMISREPRVFDAQLIGNLRQGTAFFASASMIAIGGTLALMGNTEQLAGLVTDLTHGNAPAIVWEVKVLLVVALLANAFLKFVWSHRLFGYCAVLMASVPNDPDDPCTYPRAEQAADVNITAARSYNRAMRSVYFALASVAWLLGPVALMVAVVVTTAVLYRREFASESRASLLRVPSEARPPAT
ncbi:DUF599 domain-containing protein [Microbulbifer sp. S227A]|uniref:DUF599 domain-containing protein n=1 Tax=Microbulbifer sp. S227A TaxID=3415131 RepID=UPI003C7B7348